MEINQKRVIRSNPLFKDQPVSFVAFQEQHLLAGSESLKVYDYVQNEIVKNFNIGRVKCGSELAGGMLVGLEQGHIVWMDIRAKEQTGKRFEHGSAVEDVKALPNNMGFVSVGGYDVFLMFQ